MFGGSQSQSRRSPIARGGSETWSFLQLSGRGGCGRGIRKCPDALRKGAPAQMETGRENTEGRANRPSIGVGKGNKPFLARKIRGIRKLKKEGTWKERS